MLVLSRKLGEKLLIGENITITVIKFKGSSCVRLGIEAPPEVAVRRGELPAIKPVENEHGDGK